MKGTLWGHFMATGTTQRVVRQLRRLALAEADALTDGQLLEGFVAQHDEAAFAALVRRHGPMVWGVCRRIVGHAVDAEDAFQAAFLILVRKASRVKPREAVGNWLYGVACHTALKARTACIRVRAKEKQVTSMPEPARDRCDDREELQRLLDQELSALPDKYRLPVVLCDLEGRTRREVAAQLKIPEGTLSSRLATAHHMLAKRLARHGLAVSGGSLAALLAQNAALAGMPAAVVASTIKTATLVAASQGAAAGVVSTKVAALTEGVLKAMLLTKLKIATLVFLSLALFGSGIGMLGLAAVQENEALTTDLKRIQGTWTLVAQELNGEKQKNGFKRQWTIKDGTAITTWEREPDPEVPDQITKGGGSKLTVTMEPSKTPKEITFSGDSIKLLMVYKLEKDTLTLCYFGRAEIERPKGFSVNDAGLGEQNTKLFVEVFEREKAKDEIG